MKLILIHNFVGFLLTDQHREGPLRILYNCIERKMQLKVWTRRLKGLRGVCVGYLIAYDKHLNLVSSTLLFSEG